MAVKKKVLKFDHAPIPFPKGEKLSSLLIWGIIEHTGKITIFFGTQIILLGLLIAFLTLDIHREIDKDGSARIIWGKTASEINLNYNKKVK